ncbi:MAG: phosphodiester glycosidase family protein, partial [Candidatus Cryptobacteroides sp.]|nr:phosphodiester glycosidase family protein [Candidatus Cryptobacteroides sp.]
SAGMTMDDMGAIFASLKCEAAVNLDGGGSSQILSRDPEDKTLKIRNTPSDEARRRQVIDAWCVVIDETIKEQ